MLRRALGALGAAGMTVRGLALAAPPELTLPSGGPEERFDFDAKGIEDWIKVSGQWAVEELDGTPSGKRVLIQRATKNEFNVIVAASGPYTDLDVSMKFKPISGREDASGGIVFRFNDGKYYVVRANALEDNLRLYYYDRGRRQLASARVKAPALGQWHTVRMRGGRRAHPGLARRYAAPGPSRCALHRRAAWDYGPRRTRSPRSTT